jgi:ribosomal peptide maturation radical SAM protein 1
MNMAVSSLLRRVVGDPARLPAAVAERRARLPVALVSMPFTTVGSPSIQLGSLAPLARSHGFVVETMHLYLDFAAMLGPSLSAELDELTWPTGDWLFSLAAFDQAAPDPANRFPGEFGIELPRGDKTKNIDALLEVRQRIVPAFLDAAVRSVAWQQFRVVAFTSTFQQNAASFALARRLKQELPELVIVFGGANFDGEMGREWVRTMSVIDYAVTGEGDVAFPALLSALANGSDPLRVPGVLACRGGEVVGTPPAPPFERMDELPVPDYDDFFERAERLELLSRGGRREVQIPFEGARGCWWGAKHHCTFCGLNGSAMAFRAKSKARLVDELAQLVRRYRSFDLYAVDSILHPRFLSDVAPALADLGTTYRLFYEIKANLTRVQVMGLRESGVRHVQPGIESLSSAVLALMRKGTRATLNVNLLRWCRYYGIKVYWNLLWGFPGETQASYDEQAALFPRLWHLQPPVKAGPLSVQRFSPLFEDRAAFPASRMQPSEALAYIYPSSVNLERAAYDFEYRWPDSLDDHAYAGTKREVAAWQEAWESDEQPALTFWRSPGLLQIDDARRSAEAGTHTFEEPLAGIYLACSEKASTAEKVRQELSLRYTATEVTAALEQFCERSLMMRDGSHYLALALPATGGLPGADPDAAAPVNGGSA